MEDDHIYEAFYNYFDFRDYKYIHPIGIQNKKIFIEFWYTKNNFCVYAPFINNGFNVELINRTYLYK